MNQSRREALDVSHQLEQSQHEATRVKHETSREIGKVHHIIRIQALFVSESIKSRNKMK